MFESSSCGVISALHEQSPDINQGVVRATEEDQGAGDQGMMFGFACEETKELMPLSTTISHALLQELAAIRREAKVMTYLRPDSKSQVTIEYEDRNSLPKRVHTVVLSTQHDDFDKDEVMLAKIRADVKNILLPRVIAKNPEIADLFDDKLILHVNPTGKFVIGGPHGDTGLTGRKIIVDTYGGWGAHGGGAFSGKDSSKVDRSAAYAARHVAKNIVAAGVASQALVQIAYAIGVAQPVSVSVNTFGTAKVDLSDAKISDIISGLFDLRPYAIVKRFQLTNPIFRATSNYGHFGKSSYEAPVNVMENGQMVEKSVCFFAWEKLDYIDTLKAAFKL
jgi:S-adenosylmethionine synthetase